MLFFSQGTEDNSISNSGLKEYIFSALAKLGPKKMFWPYLPILHECTVVQAKSHGTFTSSMAIS